MLVITNDELWLNHQSRISYTSLLKNGLNLIKINIVFDYNLSLVHGL